MKNAEKTVDDRKHNRIFDSKWIVENLSITELNSTPPKMISNSKNKTYMESGDRSHFSIVQTYANEQWTIDDSLIISTPIHQKSSNIVHNE